MTIGHSFKDGKPLTGCRKPILKFAYKFCSLLILFFAGMRSSKTTLLDFDYSSYLGPDYKDEPLPEHIATYVSNHTSYLDVINLVKYFAPAFAAKKSLRKVPVFGILC